jgi:hypothetical protein
MSVTQGLISPLAGTAHAVHHWSCDLLDYVRYSYHSEKERERENANHLLWYIFGLPLKKDKKKHEQEI